MFFRLAMEPATSTQRTIGREELQQDRHHSTRDRQPSLERTVGWTAPESVKAA